MISENATIEIRIFAEEKELERIAHASQLYQSYMKKTCCLYARTQLNRLCI